MLSIRTQQLSSLVAEQRHGPSRLRFSRFVEEQFRQEYAALHYPKVRALLVIAAAIIIGVTVAGIARDTVTAPTATFGLAVMLPLLMATLVSSYRSEKSYLYQPLLVASVFCLGLIVSSLSLRASLHGTAYAFGALVACIFTVWLVLGLLFWYAATAAVAISLTYAWGLFHWNFAPAELWFELGMLAGTNVIAAACSLQMEVISRQSFINMRRLNDLADRDGLTGLYNRRAYNTHMDRIWRQCRREQTQLTVMLIDIDHFKSFNDLYGHQAGDDALKRVAEVIAMGAQRPFDFAARYGGEEFSLVLYGIASEFARDLPEQIRTNIENLAIPHAESSANGCLTVSIGVCIVTPGAERSLAGAIQLADEALYQAKEDGRNRVVVNESRLTHIETGRFRAGRQAAVG